MNRNEALERISVTSKDRFLYLACGSFLGRGASRLVFECRWDHGLVIKFEDSQNQDDFQNAVEWLVWREANAHSPSSAKWLAPCVEISAGGHVLIQRRTDPCHTKQAPKYIPAWLQDRAKLENFGLIDGKFVCHDYGMTSFDLHGRNKMVRAAWEK